MPDAETSDKQDLASGDNASLAMVSTTTSPSARRFSFRHAWQSRNDGRGVG